MKNVLLPVLLIAITAGAQLPPPATPTVPPIFRPPVFPSMRPPAEEQNRFQIAEDLHSKGFYWLDTTTGNLWQMIPPAREWFFVGQPRGANREQRGTYILRPDPTGGVYILHTETGDAWWTDGVNWTRLGEPARRNR